MKTRAFKRAILHSVLLLATQSASAATVNGPHALALATNVALYSPLLGTGNKIMMRRLFNGNFNVPPNRKLSIEADTIVCQVGNVDITARSCKLTFGAKTINLIRREAHELYATMAEAGVPSDGATGTIFESLSHLACTINPQEIVKRSGGGADCTFDVGAPK